jgi:hypothetical protein
MKTFDVVLRANVPPPHHHHPLQTPTTTTTTTTNTPPIVVAGTSSSSSLAAVRVSADAPRRIRDVASCFRFGQTIVPRRLVAIGSVRVLPKPTIRDRPGPVESFFFTAHGTFLIKNNQINRPRRTRLLNVLLPKYHHYQSYLRPLPGENGPLGGDYRWNVVVVATDSVPVRRSLVMTITDLE